jgi:phosphoserine phosphatase
MPSCPWRLVTVDIDGTLTTIHGWLAIARQFGREDDYFALRRRFQSGEVGEDANLVGLLEFAEGRRLAELETVLAATPRLEHIPEGVAYLHAHGIPVALLTHNPPYITDWYRRFGGFDDAAGLAGRQPVGDVIGRAEGIRADKLGGLDELTRRLHVAAPTVVHVGDAPPDAAVFPRVGGGIALNAHRTEVEDAADLALRTNDFHEVAEAVLKLPVRS